ncbi:hypothetical protein CTEN210_02858 [Chaetoceros tenuissimus]|uniref:Peptidase M11 gametolysin domain-containing protein n=1 Tax=Chaetoceros tenuissimus TaxID=426638 RepID=A0AAD3H1G5_9STRA|nr:hypothetical protein CTEN210_02858 [Chaetoceros tenuissimus]
MHEIGHNWNLGHSGYNGLEYGDESGVMGGIWFDNVCYNAAYNTQLGFYSDKTVQVTSSWSGKLYGLSSYSSAGSDDAIILHIPKGTNGSSRDYYSYSGAPLEITVNYISGSTFAQVTVGTGVNEDDSCTDFPDTLRFTKKKIVSCSEMTPYRCSKTKGKSLCPNACGTTATWCSRDAKGDENGETIYKGCPFVARQPDKIASRCSKGNVALACRATCQNN